VRNPGLSQTFVCTKRPRERANVEKFPFKTHFQNPSKRVSVAAAQASDIDGAPGL
jgi:hypothetical protein